MVYNQSDWQGDNRRACSTSRRSVAADTNGRVLMPISLIAGSNVHPYHYVFILFFVYFKENLRLPLKFF